MSEDQQRNIKGTRTETTVLPLICGRYSLKSPSFPTTVIFLIISCFWYLTMDEVLSVILLKKAGGWEVLGGEREPSLRGGHDGTRKGQTLTGQRSPQFYVRSKSRTRCLTPGPPGPWGQRPLPDPRVLSRPRPETPVRCRHWRC